MVETRTRDLTRTNEFPFLGHPFCTLIMNNDDGNLSTTRPRGSLNIFVPTFTNPFAKIVQEPHKTPNRPDHAGADTDRVLGKERRFFDPPPQTPQKPQKLPPLFQFPRHDDNTSSALSPYVKLLNGKGPKTTPTPTPQFQSHSFQRRSSSLSCMPSLSY